MKQQRFNEAQIIGILKQQESGVTVAQICREHAISEGTFYRWKSKYGGMEVHEATRLRQLEQENSRLKKLLAESMLDVAALKDVLQKNGDAERSASAPAAKKEVAGYLQEQHQLSKRRACAVAGIPTCTVRYQSRKPDEAPVRARLKELAQERPRFGYRRLGVLLRREGHPINLKRVLRLYREENLKLRARKRKRITSARWADRR